MKLSRTMIDKLMQTLEATHLWQELFKYDELTMNMRQKDDQSYRNILPRIRVGIITDADSRTLESRKINFKSEEINNRLSELCDILSGLPKNTVCILSTRHFCDVITEAMLNRIDSTEIKLIAQVSIDCKKAYLKKV